MALANFQRISFDEANPSLVGAERGQKFMTNAMNLPLDIQQKLLANQLAQVQSQYAPQTAQAKLQQLNLRNRGLDLTNQKSEQLLPLQREIAEAQMHYQQAQANKMNYLANHPGFMGGPEAKNLEGLRQMGLLDSNYRPINVGNSQQQPSVQIPYKFQNDQSMSTQEQQAQSPLGGLVESILKKPQTDLQYKEALIKSINQNLSDKAYRLMPAAEKSYSIAQARGFGYTGEEASKLFSQGKDLSWMASQKGYDPQNTSDWPVARSAPTSATQTRIQRANSTLAGLDSVQEDITDAYSKYAARFKGVSPSLIKDMVFGMNKDDQAKAFAAYALHPEYMALRINAQGGNVGEGAIDRMSQSAYSTLNTLGLSPDSEVYKKSQQIMNDWIRRMNKAENKAIYGQMSFGEDEKKSSQNGPTKPIKGGGVAQLINGKWIRIQ